MSYSLGERLAFLRKRNNLSQEKFAQAINNKFNTKLNKGMISKWENNREVPTTNNLRLIANYYGVTIDLFLVDAKDEAVFNDQFDLIYSGQAENVSDITMPDNMIPLDRSGATVKIPVLGEIACGEPITAVENVNEYRTRVSEGLPSGEVFYLKAKGNSMSPTIQDGSLVLIKSQPDVESGEIAAVLVNGDTEATLKRVKKQGDLVLLIPDNNEYDTYVVTPEKPARILGKAVEVMLSL